MADSGLCSQVEEKYGRTRYLKWEDIVLEGRSGNVTEIDVGCSSEEDGRDEGGESRTQDCKCEQETTLSRWDLLRGREFYNRTVTGDLVEELRQTWDILGDFKGATVTERFIAHFKLFEDGKKCN